MKKQSSFPLELLAMVAVIAISSWHVGNYMEKFDGWIMAVVMGATLGFCNFLCAHDLFKTDSTSRRPASAGLLFFAITSTWMQYTYYNANPAIGQTLISGVNLDALALGMWAPAAEILLGWLRASKSSQDVNASNATQQPGVMNLLGSALAKRIEASTHPHHPPALDTNPPSNHAVNISTTSTVPTSNPVDTSSAQNSSSTLSKEAEKDNKPATTNNQQPTTSNQSPKLTREQRHLALLNWLNDVNSESQIQPSKLADQFNVTRQTIHNDLTWLQENGRLHINGTVRVMG